MTSVIICCGVGGVGKTTTSAALSLSLALSGQRVVVLTIDPARRLADALGIQELGNQPTRIPINADAAAGSLDALMLDQKQTWDEVIRRFAASDTVAEKLLANRYYKAISERLSGSHEYMAVEKLYDLVHSKRWDIVVVDTPPAQHTLDFFRAPDRIRKILNRTALRTFIEPGRGLLGVATSGVMSIFRRVAGESVLGDIQEFFELLSGFSSGFRERSEAVKELLASDRTSYYLVASANDPQRSDFLGFLNELQSRQMHVAGFFLNRHANGFSTPNSTRPVPPPGVHASSWETYWDQLMSELAQVEARHQAQRQHAERIATQTGIPIWLIPELSGAITSLEGLRAVAAYLPPQATSSLGTPG